MNDHPEKPKIDVEAIRQQVVSLLQGRGVTQATIAKQANVSTGALSKFIVGRYEGDNDAVARKIATWLVGFLKRDKLPATVSAGHRFVRTAASVKTTSRAEHAQVSADLVIVIGDPGSGKTTVLQHICRTGASVFLATMSPDTSGTVPMLEEVADALGIQPPNGGGARRLRSQIEKRLRGSAGLLIIDEAQHLCHKALETLRRIHDTAQVGMLLAGSPDLMQRIAQMPQASSRIGWRVTLRRPSRADVNALAAEFGIDGRQEQDFLHSIAQHPGGLRCVVKTIRLAMLAAEGDDAALDTGHLTAAWSERALVTSEDES
ncbi:MAG TPA: AAA family ATPase [Stellaceae bacterium]|nr:AAA family ATPase [Stellaceae bacterium]